MTKRFYVTMTWDDWPEGGSYGTVIEADTPEEAQSLCRTEMANLRGEAVSGMDDEADADFYLENFSDGWYLVDCFDLDEFIGNHRR